MSVRSRMGSNSRIVALAIAVVIAIAANLMPAPATAAGVHAPLGYQLMCLQSPQECKGGGKPSVALTADLMSTLQRVNSHINRTIMPRQDSGADVWSAAASAGDCEDYVLAKRRALIKAGIPASSLRIAYVKTRRGEGHAILVVKTNRKDLVLDNLSATVEPLSRSGYSVVSMSGAKPNSWS